MVIWHVLATGKTYADLGSDFYATRADPAKEAQRLIARLEALGHKVPSHPPPEPLTRTSAPVIRPHSADQTWLRTCGVAAA